MARRRRSEKGEVMTTADERNRGMKRWIPLPAAVLVLLLALAGCGGGDSDTSSSEEATAEETVEAEGADGGEEPSGGGKSVVYISPVASQPGQQALNLGLEQGAKELGWSEFV